jgi:hypothetical protein
MDRRPARREDEGMNPRASLMSCPSLPDTDSEPIRQVTGLAALELIAQPMWLRVARHLRHGPATSGALAHALGESTDLTAHYLRQMARHGFLEELPVVSRSGEHWWRSTCADLQFPPRAEQDQETRSLVDEINRISFAADLEDFARAQLDQAGGESWAGQPTHSRGTIYVTSDELQEFFAEYIKLLSRYQRPDGKTPPGARPVLTRFIAFPAPAPVSEETVGIG